MDPRLNEPLRDWLTYKDIPLMHDLISIPGGPKDILDEDHGLFRALEDVSLVLHEVKKVVLVQHTDCGAYGGRARCGGTEEADLQFQTGQLRRAANLLVRVHPELELVLVVAHIHDDQSIEFKEL